MKNTEKEYRFWNTLIYLSDQLRNNVVPDSLPEESDISLRQHHVMTEVWRMTENKQEGINLKDLAKRLKLTPGTVSELVETLVRKDALQRVQNPMDRRAVLITLTERSLRLVDESKRKTNALSAKILSCMDEAEQEALIQSMEKLERYVKEQEHENE